MGWKTAMQTEGDEQRLIYDVPVRKSPLVVPHPQYGVSIQAEFSGTQMPTPPERRLRPGLAAPQGMVSDELGVVKQAGGEVVETSAPYLPFMLSWTLEPCVLDAGFV